MLPLFCTQTITRIRATGTIDVRGSEVPDWEHASTLDIVGCSVQPTSTSLSQDGRVLGISETLTAYLPEGSDVLAGDRIVFEGETYTIDGEPKKWTAPLTRSNIQLTLRKWEG